MTSPFYTSTYNTAVTLLNRPFKDMRETPEATILNAVKNAVSALAMQGHHLTGSECDTMYDELLETQRQAKASGRGTFAATF